jgi:hypothetical protein
MDVEEGQVSAPRRQAEAERAAWVMCAVGTGEQMHHVLRLLAAAVQAPVGLLLAQLEAAPLQHCRRQAAKADERPGSVMPRINVTHRHSRALCLARTRHV